MTELDDKLNLILRRDSAFSDMYQTIEDIKQVFSEAEYVKPEDDIEVKDNVLRIRDLQLMTGQQFYERFEKELQGCIFSDEHAVREAVNQCWDAAKRAAGLTDA